MSIDTLAVARRLESAKLPREQAEAIAAVIHDSESTTLANLATRAELQNGLDRLSKEIETLRRETNADLRPLEQRMTIKLGMMLVGAIAVMTTLAKLL